MRFVKDADKKTAFNRIWFKTYNSPMRDKLKSKLQVRGLEPSEKNAFEYWMGYIKPITNKWNGKTTHENPMWSRYNRRNDNGNKKKQSGKSRRMGRHPQKKN